MKDAKQETMSARVADVMTRDVFAVAPDTDLETAARLLVQRRVTGAPVITADARAVGVVSLMDLVDPDRDRDNEDGYPIYYKLTEGWASVLGDGVECGHGRVEEVMTRSVLAVAEDTTITKATELMLEFGVHRLLVTSGDQLVGIVSTVDLLRGFIGQPSTQPA